MGNGIIVAYGSCRVLSKYFIKIVSRIDRHMRVLYVPCGLRKTFVESEEKRLGKKLIRGGNIGNVRSP